MSFNKKLVQHLTDIDWVYTKHEVNSIYDTLRFQDYELIPDTSSWLMLSGPKGHIFTIANPNNYNAGWTSNLIMKLIELSSK